LLNRSDGVRGDIAGHAFPLLVGRLEIGQSLGVRGDGLG
jgi:hypothetical protein